ncbi:MAG: hypothetical protein P0107_02310 [Nitrosomonas sp.]|nr:hypothetical protein [Nitrosomonas sp.]
MNGSIGAAITALGDFRLSDRADIVCSIMMVNRSSVRRGFSCRKSSQNPIGGWFVC